MEGKYFRLAQEIKYIQREEAHRLKDNFIQIFDLAPVDDIQIRIFPIKLLDEVC